jgi:hypothetical protein
MNRLTQLPPDMIKQISGFLPDKESRNALRKSDVYLGETLGPSEIEITDLPTDMIKEIGSYLKGPSKTAFRSSHPIIRKHVVDLKKEIKDMVKSRLARMTNGLKADLKKMEQLIEDMFELYTGKRSDSVQKLNNYGIYFIFDPYVITSLLESNSQTNAPKWFDDVIKGTDFNYWIQKIGLYELLNVNNLHNAFKKNYNSWSSFENNLLELILVSILISKGYDAYIDDEINLKQYDMEIEKEPFNQNKELRVFFNNQDSKIQIIVFKIKGNQHQVQASSPTIRNFILDVINGTKFWDNFDHLYESTSDGKKFWHNLNKLYKTL